MTKQPHWRFRAMQKGEINVDPVHDEFFKAQDLVDALVRESIQNSLDARRSRAPVRIRFGLATGSHALDREKAERYLAGLSAHLRAVAPEIRSQLPDITGDMPYLVIEDYGTRGLTGDPTIEIEAQPGQEKNDFYYFWRNVGRSMKSENARGRWGLGKAVFSVSSQIRAVIGLTQRANESRRLLMGQSVLKVHTLDEVRHYPYGFFGRFDGDLALPIEDDIYIWQFARDLELLRDEPGLSLVIPWFRADELSYEALIASVVRQYFYPITRGDLVVEIREGTRSETISGRSIEEVAARHLAPDVAGKLSRLCDLTRWSIWVDDTQSVILPEPEGASAPRWPPVDSDVELIEESRLLKLRQRFHEGERIAFRIPLFVKKTPRRQFESYFDVYMEKDESLKREDHHYIRRGITIPDVFKGRSPHHPVRAILVVDDEALSTLLGDAENPAHADWAERADKIRANYHQGPSTIRYVKQSLQYLSALVLRSPEAADRDLLRDIFSVATEPGASQGGKSRGSGEGDVETQANAFGVIESHRGVVRLEPVAGGFVVQSVNGAFRTGITYRAEAAYRVRAGNPFRKYSPFDFRLSKAPIALEPSDVALQQIGDNWIIFTPLTAEFRLRIRGFDERRDLVVRLTRHE